MAEMQQAGFEWGLWGFAARLLLFPVYHSLLIFHIKRNSSKRKKIPQAANEKRVKEIPEERCAFLKDWESSYETLMSSPVWTLGSQLVASLYCWNRITHSRYWNLGLWLSIRYVYSYLVEQSVVWMKWFTQMDKEKLKQKRWSWKKKRKKETRNQCSNMSSVRAPAAPSTGVPPVANI